MKTNVSILLLAACLSLSAAEAPLPECAPRAGLPNFFAKLERGDTVRIGYLGGSITAQDGWRPKTLKWFQAQYPKATISEINAAIGAPARTSASFGCDRKCSD